MYVGQSGPSSLPSAYRLSFSTSCKEGEYNSLRGGLIGLSKRVETFIHVGVRGGGVHSGKWLGKTMFPLVTQLHRASTTQTTSSRAGAWDLLSTSFKLTGFMQQESGLIQLLLPPPGRGCLSYHLGVKIQGFGTA